MSTELVITGEPPHPQALFLGFSPDDPDFQALARLVATARLVPDEGWPLAGLRPAEWDIAITKGPSPLEVPGHMHVLALGCTEVGLVKISSNGYVAASYGGSQPSTILKASGSGLSDELRRLVTGDLVPWLDAQAERPYLTHRISTGFGKGAARLPVGEDQVVFVADADGGTIAGALPRQGTGWVWALPYIPEHPELWLAAALIEWHQRTPERVPALPAWRTRPAWRTHAETAAHEALTAARREQVRIATKMKAREATLTAAAAVAAAEADYGLRKLLTAQGDELVAAVTAALEALGFEVTNVDDDLAPGVAKIEDLRLLDLSEPAWTNLTEVKGYTGGAKARDLLLLARYANLFQRRTNALPTSRWYIVNQFLGTDPDARQAVLRGADEDIATFAEDGGLVIDTRDLFVPVRLVEEGALTAEQARARLRSAVGVFQAESGC